MEDLLIQKDEKSPVTIQISPESPLPNEEEKSPSPKIADPISPSKMPVSAKQILNLNLSKFLTEIGGTAILGVFYSLMGDQQSGLFLGVWVLTLWGISISGAHFNPAITFAFMLRKDCQFAKENNKLLGSAYIGA